MDTKHTELCKLAEAATPGPWVAIEFYVHKSDEQDTEEGLVADCNSMGWRNTKQATADATSISATSPSTLYPMKRRGDDGMAAD